ncbi:di-trans,poly-cis-decaprenylcistransferase [Candidatus Woesearchaeota archaeon]|nr:di-trans,poly-cis-decaprenylcistransferase [Candidatus Woesearchaeota archaeon]
MVSKAPNHIGIILDGNRRYAKKLGLNSLKGHEFGLKKLEDLFKWCRELGVKELTLYTFSTENFNRTKREIDYLFGLFRNEIEDIKEKKGVFKEGIRFNFIGRINMFPKGMKRSMLEIMSKTKKYSKFTVNFAMAYGGRQEIVDAFRKAIKNSKKIKPSDINESLITQNLYLQSEPDMVIRPGGEIRTSNFLMWQSAYSEWIFVKKLWPEFKKKDLVKCVQEFNKRERRFGE